MRKRKAQKIINQLTTVYDEIADQFSQTRYSARNDFEGFKTYLKQTQRILDLGCGNGRLLLFLQNVKIAGKQFKFTYQGIDTSKKLIKLAKNKFPQHKFSYGNQLLIPVEDHKFDIIFNIRSFHHIPSKKLRKEALKEMQRVSQKNGIIVITVWNLWQFKYVKNIIQAVARSIITLGAYDYNDTFIKWGRKHKRYYHAFTLKELRKLAKYAGLEIIKDGKLNHDYQLILKNCKE